MSMSQIVSAIICCVALVGCDEESARAHTAVEKRGAELIAAHGCGLCHEIPGIAGARGHVGPSLKDMGRREYVAGILHNSPDNLALWIADPQEVVPGNAMPDMGISRGDARQIAAYLNTLR